MFLCKLFEWRSALRGSHQHFFAYVIKKKATLPQRFIICNTERWAAYHSATLEYKKAYAVAQHSFFSDTLPSLLQSNPRKFWCIVDGPKSKNIDLCDELGLAIASDRCCEALQEVFKNSFSVDNSNHLPVQADPGYPRMEPIIIDQLGLFHLILKMKASAPGIDGIAPQFLKQTAIYCSVIFSQLFSQ